MMNKCITAVCLTVVMILGAAIYANATPILTSGQLTGATDVSVSGALYNVQFLEGSFDTIYPDLTILPFTTYDAAQAASAALLTQVFTGDYDTSPNLTYGIDLLVGYILTPYQVISPSQVDVAYARNGDYNPCGNTVSMSSVDPTIAMSEWHAHTYAVWSLVDPSSSNAAPVPEPSTFLMLGAGLTGLVVYRKKRQV